MKRELRLSLFKGMVVVVVSFLLRFGGMIAPPLFLCCVRHVNGAFVERIIPPSSLRLVRLSFTGKALPTSQYRQQQQQQQQPHDNYSSLFPSPDLFRQGRGQLLESASSEMEEDPTQSEEEWYPRDPAYTTPQLLVGLWSQIAQASTMAKGETMTVLYPQMEEQLTPRYLNLLMAHLDQCKDVCDVFGITSSLVPFSDKLGKVVGFTVRSHADPEDRKKEYEFEYDPYWDDGTDYDALYQNIDDEYGDSPKTKYPAIDNKVPDDDELIIGITKKWVNKMMSDLGICPFTAGPDLAGLPVGNVFYRVDRSNHFEDMYHQYWREVVRLERNNEKDMSTILLITPEFCLDNLELFDSFTTTLTQPLIPLEIENLLQLVFFHPQWCFRDGSARSGESEAANYARRSPWPMFNLLRTSQVRKAQKGIPTGLVYKQNEKTLQGIGTDKLETMLRLRDWSDIADLQVNRREYDALKIAQDFQATGVVRQEDMSLAHDATPAVNKVDRRQVDQGNLVKVVLQAMEKRLGKAAGQPMPLTGPETSATAMASDFLVEELNRIVSQEDSSAHDPISVTAAAGSDVETDELRRMKDNRLEEARKAIFEDLRASEKGSSRSPERFSTARDPITAALFGKGGVDAALAESDELFQEGMNPDNFF